MCIALVCDNNIQICLNKLIKFVSKQKINCKDNTLRKGEHKNGRLNLIFVKQLFRNKVKNCIIWALHNRLYPINKIYLIQYQTVLCKLLTSLSNIPYK